jgi:CheY-like chemotaxis protein
MNTLVCLPKNKMFSNLKNILIIENNDFSLEITKLICRRIKEIAPEIDLNIDIAKTSNSGILKLREKLYDICLFDYPLDIYYDKSDIISNFMRECERIIQYIKENDLECLILLQADSSNQNIEKEISKKLKFDGYIERVNPLSDEIYYARLTNYLTTQKNDVIRKRLLIVDDDTSNGEIVRDGLEIFVKQEFSRFRLRIDIATTSKVVSINMKKWHYDLCLLDFMITYPSDDRSRLNESIAFCKEVVEKIRNSGNNACPIILYSGHEDIEHYTSSIGVDGYLEPRPYEEDALQILEKIGISEK